MSNPPGVERTLQLLEGFKSAMRELATREESLRKISARKRAMERARRGAALAADQARMAAQLQQAEAAALEAREAANLRHRARAARILEAQRNARKAALQRINAIEGKWKFELQREMLSAAREREAGLAAADAALAEFQARVATQEVSLRAIDETARVNLGVYGKAFLNRWATAHETAHVETLPSEHAMSEALQRELEVTGAEVAHFRSRFLTRFSSLWALWLVLAFTPLPLLPVLAHFGINQFGLREAIGVGLGLAAFAIVLHYLGKGLAKAPAERVIAGLGRARILHHAALEKATETHATERQQVEARYEAVIGRGNEAWSHALDDVEARRNAQPRLIDEKAARLTERNERRHRETLDRIEQAHANRLEQLKSGADASLLAKSPEENAGQEDGVDEEDRGEWEAFRADFRHRVREFVEAIRVVENHSASRAPAWNARGWEAWSPPAAFPQAVRWGRAEVDLNQLAAERPVAAGMEMPIPAQLSLPLLLTYPEEGSLVIETRRSGRAEAQGVLNQVVLRLLASMPPGRIEFTILDPVGLGQGFAGLMHLADEADHLIHGKVWTQASQIEERLGELNDHMEKVIQMYLRNEYATIAEYNRQAGNIAEKYHILVIADFPAGFSDTALRRLQSVLSSGARCGVHTLIHHDLDQSLPSDFGIQELRKSAVSVGRHGQNLVLNGRVLPGVEVRLEPPPEPEVATPFIQRVARASIDSNRIEVPFEQVTPADSEWWSLDTAGELKVPIGRTGATKLQYLALGKGTRQHALIAGKTGSGKSTLFHVIITNLSLWCAPDQVEFYLVDFKKGVEFNGYAAHRLPHARVIAIESDRDFGLSVLQRVDEELKRRGDLFRAARVQDIAGYRKAAGAEPMPRVLLMIDEFQEFFVEEDRIAQSASVLLDRIVRQGRAFGIHVILGSQTLGGAYTVARSTLGQMVVRIALQCNEADAYLIMDDTNPAPRLLSRPGEGIYNDAAGAREANSPFQAVWLPDDLRDAWLRQVRARADAGGFAGATPMVFEGDLPADVRENTVLEETLAANPAKPPALPRVWLGAPNSIKGPTEAVFARRTGDHLLIVGQREDAAVAMLGIAMLSLAAQFPKDAMRLYVLDASGPDSAPRMFLERVVSAVPQKAELVRPGDLDSVLTQLRETFGSVSDEERPTTFLLIHGIQNFKKLRQEDEFGFGDGESGGAAANLLTLISEGAANGFHVIATCDTYGNVTRALGRKALSHFAMRVLFQMSANDSANLIDSPAASRLGLHRALSFQEREGHIEIFRPYAQPPAAWLESVTQRLAAR